MKVLVTGVCGYIGKKLIAYLDNSKYEVYGLDRLEIPELSNNLAGFYRCDLSVEENLRTITEKIDVIVHLAGEADVHANRKSQFENNFIGSKNLLNNTKRLGATKLIYLSSNKVGSKGEYAKVKQRVENELASLGKKEGLKYTVLRSAIVYGPGMRSNIAKWIRTIERNGFFALPRSQAVLEMIGIEDLCKAIVISMEDNSTNNKVYEISDGQSYNINEIERVSRELFGRKKSFLTIPRWSLYMLSKLGDLSGRTAFRIPVNSETYELLFNKKNRKNHSFESDTGFCASQNFLRELPVIFGT